MKWAVIEGDEIISIYQGQEPPEGSVLIPEGLNPFRLSWDGETLSEAPTDALEAERAAANREYRNQLLSSTDWTQLPDAPLTDEQKAAYGAYRQALRDLPNHVNFPNLSADDWPQVEEQ
jgi:hypothetical protein